MPKFRIAIILAVSAPMTSSWAQDSLQIDPQRGATPQTAPAEPVQEIEPALRSDLPVVSQAPLSVPESTLGPPPEIRLVGPEVTLGSAESALPTPVEDPMKLDRSSDAVLALAESTTDPAAFADAIRKGAEQHPSISEAEADRDEAVALRNEARALEYPVVDLNVTHFRVIDRQFSNDPDNILERSRPRKRTDAQVQVNAPLFDFGRLHSRIKSANERIAAADANVDDYAVRLAQSSIAAWYQVFTYRALVRLAEAFVANQEELHAALSKRVQQGLSAPADLAQYDSYRASAQAQLADLRRDLSSSEAQYKAYIGEPAPANLGRAPAARSYTLEPDAIPAVVEALPAVERARRLERAAQYDSKAAAAAMLPSVSAGITGGRYGVFETDRDYDIRASVTLTQRLFGGGKQRFDQASARQRRALASLERVRLEAGRDAQIASADVEALQQSTAALRENYFASRQSRDALFERFRASRGTLNDVLTAQTNYFNVAVRYVAAISELDIARYVLLARTGQLTGVLNLPKAGSGK